MTCNDFTRPFDGEIIFPDALVDRRLIGGFRVTRKDNGFAKGRDGRIHNLAIGALTFRQGAQAAQHLFDICVADQSPPSMLLALALQKPATTQEEVSALWARLGHNNSIREVPLSPWSLVVRNLLGDEANCVLAATQWVKVQDVIETILRAASLSQKSEESSARRD